MTNLASALLLMAVACVLLVDSLGAVPAPQESVSVVEPGDQVCVRWEVQAGSGSRENSVVTRCFQSPRQLLGGDDGEAATATSLPPVSLGLPTPPL